MCSPFSKSWVAAYYLSACVILMYAHLRVMYTHELTHAYVGSIFVIAKVARVFHHVPGKSDCKMHARCWFPHYFAEGLHFSASRYGYALSSRRTAVLYQASKCILTARIRFCNQKNKEKRTHHYNLHESTVETKGLSVQKKIRHICTNMSLKHKVIQPFRTSRKCLVKCTKPCKLTNAVLNK